MQRSPVEKSSNSSSNPRPCTTQTLVTVSSPECTPQSSFHIHPTTSPQSSTLSDQELPRNAARFLSTPLPDEIWVMILTHLPVKDLYRMERVCRSWYSRLVPAAKYSKIITGLCQLTLLTHVWLEADSDDDDDGETDCEDQISKSICTEMCEYGDCDDTDNTDSHHNPNPLEMIDTQPPGADHVPLATRLQPIQYQQSSSLQPSSSRRPLRHAITAVPLICTGVHTFSKSSVFRSPKHLILPELETNCELLRFELQFSDWPIHTQVRQKVAEMIRDSNHSDHDHPQCPQQLDEGFHPSRYTTGATNMEDRQYHSSTGIHAPLLPSPSSRPSMPIRLSTSFPAADSSRDFNHRQTDEMTKYFSKARIHKCSRRPIGQCWRAGDAGHSLSSYEVVVVGGSPGEDVHSESDHDADESDGSSLQSNKGSLEDNERRQPAHQTHGHHIFPGPPASISQWPTKGISRPPLPPRPDDPYDRPRPGTLPSWEGSQHRVPGSRKNKRPTCPDSHEPHALLVYASEDIPPESYDPETHVPILDPQNDLLTYDADLTWRDAQRVSEIWVYITASFIASGFYGPRGARHSDHADCPLNSNIPYPNSEEIPSMARLGDHETIQLFHQDHWQQSQPQHPLLGNHDGPPPSSPTLHPAIQGLRNRYEKCWQKAMECKSRSQSLSPPLTALRSTGMLQPTPYSPPLLSPSTIPSPSSPWPGHGSSTSTPLGVPPPASQHTLLRIAVIHEFKERVTLLQKIAEEEQLPWLPHYLNDMRVLRWVASRDTCFTRDDAITDRENAVTIMRRLANHPDQQVPLGEGQGPDDA